MPYTYKWYLNSSKGLFFKQRKYLFYELNFFCDKTSAALFKHNFKYNIDAVVFRTFI